VEKEEVAIDVLSRRTEWGVLNAVKNYHKWDDVPPRRIVKVEKIEAFVENECKPWAKSSDVQAAINTAMISLARRYGDPVIVSDDAHYARRDDKIVQDVRMAQSGNWRFWGSYHADDGGGVRLLRGAAGDVR